MDRDEGDAAEIREDLAELYRMASDADMDTKKGKEVVVRISKRIATEMVRKGKIADGEASEAAVARLQKEILARMANVSFCTICRQKRTRLSPFSIFLRLL